MSNKDQEVHPCPKFIAMQIKYWRKQKKMTQQKLSDVSGIKMRHFQEIESGRVDMKVRTLGLIAQALSITPHKLLTPVDQNREFMCEHCRDMV